MRFRKSRRTPPEPRLLPLDAYPAEIDEAGRDRVDVVLREQLNTIPVEPDEYLDSEGDRWTLGADGLWTDAAGHTRSSLYTPIVSTFGPFTRPEKPCAPDPRQGSAHG